MTNTANTTKQGLITYLKDYLANARVVDANLKSRIQYALDMVKKDLKKVAKADLESLVAEVKESIALTEKKPVEASTKPKKLGGSKKSKDEPIQQTLEDTDDDSDNEDNEEKSEKAPAKPATKSKDKSKSVTKATDNSKVQTAAHITSKTGVLPTAKIFPKEIDHPELGKLVAVPDKYHKYEDIVNALNETDDEGNPLHTIYLATYWSKRQIKEYDYARAYLVPESSIPKNGFIHDLDILQVVLTLETMKRFFALSAYTEALLTFEDGDLTPVEDTDPADGSKYRIRVAGGLEFEIYVPADEVESK